MSNITSKSGLYGGGSGGSSSSVTITPGQGSIDTGVFGGFGWLENWLKASIDFDVGWTYNGTSLGSYAYNSPLNQDSGNTATDARQINGGTLATHGLYQDALTSPATANTTWTARAFVWNPSGSAFNVSLRLDSGNETGTPSTVSCPPNQWTAITVTQSFTAGSTGTVRCHIINGTNTIGLWGVQLVRSSSIGLFYPTNRNYTVGANGVTGHYGWVLGAGNSQAFNPNDGAIKIFTGGSPGKSPLQILNFGDAYYQAILSVYGSGYGESSTLAAYDGGFGVTTALYVDSSVGRVELSRNSTAGIFYRNNIAILPGIRIKGASGQSANLYEGTDNSNNLLWYVTRDGCIGMDKTVPAPGTTGNQTINKPAGGVRIAAGQNSVTVTNALVDANTHVVATVCSNDSTLKSVSVVASAGSFTVTGNANATAEVLIRWFLIK